MDAVSPVGIPASVTSENKMDVNSEIGNEPAIKPRGCVSVVTKVFATDYLEWCLRRGDEAAVVKDSLVQAIAAFTASSYSDDQLAFPIEEAGNDGNGETDSSTDLPEVVVCRWLSTPAAEFEKGYPRIAQGILSTEKVWPPLRLRLLECLAGGGARHEVSELLAKDGATPSGTLYLDLLEFGLEVPSRGGLPDDWLESVGRADFPLIDEAVSGAWRRLLLVEGAAACGRDVPSAEPELAELAQFVPVAEPDPFSLILARRISRRAAAALVRLRLGKGSEWWDVLEWESFLGLDDWERLYLCGLVEWRSGNLRSAAEMLAESRQLNPGNGFVKIAEAVLLSVTDPDSALSLLDSGVVSFDGLVSKMAILSRLKHYAYLAQLVEVSPVEADWEPLRFSWTVARDDLRRQYRAIRSAIAERNKDWSRAYQEAAVIRTNHSVKALLDGRLAFLAGRELDAIPEVERWRREQVERRRERHFRATSLKKPAGDELWYSALARVNSEPEGVVNDFLKLVGQAGWLRAQNQGGGQRVTMAGDVLLRLGQTSAAKRAYLLSGENGFGLDHRRELADRLMLLENRGDLGTSETSSGDSMESGDATAVLTLLEGLIHFALGRKSVALETIQGIVVKGFHVYLCQWILNVLGLSNFDIEGMPAIDDFPQVLIPAFKLCHSREVLSDRVGKYIESTGAQWMTSCPLDPEIVARAHIDRLCQNHKWEEAKKWLAGVSPEDHIWARDVGSLVALREVLNQAMCGSAADAAVKLRNIFETLDEK